MSYNTPFIYDAGLVSLETADNTAGLSYPSAANSWVTLTLAANKGVYATSGSALTTYDLSASGRAIANVAITAKGDTVVGTGSGTVGVLPAGTDGYVLVYDSTTSTGLAARLILAAMFINVPAAVLNADSSGSVPGTACGVYVSAGTYA